MAVDKVICFFIGHNWGSWSKTPVRRYGYIWHRICKRCTKYEEKEPA